MNIQTSFPLSINFPLVTVPWQFFRMILSLLLFPKTSWPPPPQKSHRSNLFHSSQTIHMKPVFQFMFQPAQNLTQDPALQHLPSHFTTRPTCRNDPRVWCEHVSNSPFLLTRLPGSSATCQRSLWPLSGGHQWNLQHLLMCLSDHKDICQQCVNVGLQGCQRWISMLDHILNKPPHNHHHHHHQNRHHQQNHIAKGTTRHSTVHEEELHFLNLERAVLPCWKNEKIKDHN